MLRFLQRCLINDLSLKTGHTRHFIMPGLDDYIWLWHSSGEYYIKCCNGAATINITTLSITTFKVIKVYDTQRNDYADCHKSVNYALCRGVVVLSYFKPIAFTEKNVWCLTKHVFKMSIKSAWQNTLVWLHYKHHMCTAVIKILP
jgi:hypothetical protein